IGHVVDAEDLEATLDLGLRRIAGAIDRSGKRHGLAEFATIDLTAVQALDQIGDEAFHARPPWCGVAPAPIVVEASSLARRGKPRWCPHCPQPPGDRPRLSQYIAETAALRLDGADQRLPAASPH